jgi:hypothetical protein
VAADVKSMSKNRSKFFFVQFEFSISFLGSFGKFQNATINFAGTVRPQETFRLQLDGFS